MSRKRLSFPVEKIQPFDLETLQRKAAEMNGKNRETFTTPFPKAPDRWVSHYRFEPRSIEFTSEGEVEGKMSRLMGSLFDFSFTRAVFAPYYSKKGGHCFDPASLFFLELSGWVDLYPDRAAFCRDLHQKEAGRSYRELAGLERSIPDEVDLCNFRYRVGSPAIDSLLAEFVRFFQELGLLKGELLTTDGYLVPSNSRFKGCAHFCEGCRQLRLNEDQRQEICRQLKDGAKRLQILCPFPEVVQKVQKAAARKGKPRLPQVALLEVKYLSSTRSRGSDPLQLAQWLDLPADQIPPLRIQWSRLQQGRWGELLGSCPKVPSDLDGRMGCHVDNKNPDQKEWVFGYNHIRTTDRNEELDLELPIAHSTEPANANEGNCFPQHRSKAALPPLADRVEVLDSAYDQTPIYQEMRQSQTIPIIAYNSRNEKRSPEALLERGYNENGVPYAPCGRLCHSNGYNFQTDHRLYVCGLPCPPQEQQQCSHGEKVRGYSRRMSFADYPRLIGPIQRGTPTWEILYDARSASERTNSYDQEVILNGRPPRLRGLKAFRFSGAIRTLAQLLRRALNFVLDVTSTLGKLALPGET